MGGRKLFDIIFTTALLMPSIVITNKASSSVVVKNIKSFTISVPFNQYSYFL